MVGTGALPKAIDDPDIVAIMQSHKLTGTPEHIAYQNLDPRYAPAQCHITVRHRVETVGGSRVHGWAFWQFDDAIYAEFHSVWQSPNGDLIDLTPPRDGGSQVLFLRDPTLSIESVDGNFWLRTDLTPFEKPRYYLMGEPNELPIWGMTGNNPTIVKYCDKLGISPGL